jgi:aspartyl-tRNA(Asn)/glutamyl-tRNA(Gln) amidotransferase subunit B
MDQAIRDKYQEVIGLEIHVQLLTKTKAYSGDTNEYGNLPNTNISVVNLAHPGTLPRSNKKVIDFGIKLGLAVGSEITRYNTYDRKNYFYPDSPKNYQLTQDLTPICVGGFIPIVTKSGLRKTINLTRIHMEEDAGKSMHIDGESESLIDLNRAGVPLLEIVTEPEFRSSEEAYAFVAEVRKLVRYLEICDGNMEEGSMRCDANISVMLKDAKEFGKRVEVKNMNSMRNVARAIDYEIGRQIELNEEGKSIFSETRLFDAVNGVTQSMRAKEELNDYRYFPEPDLQPVVISEEWINKIKGEMPPLPNDLIEKFTNQYGLSEYDARVLTDQKDIALYFEELCGITDNYKAATNWVMGAVKSYLNELTLSLNEFPLSPLKIEELIALVADNKVSNSVATKNLFPALINAPEKSALAIAEELNLIQNSNSDAIQGIVDSVLADFLIK